MYDAEVDSPLGSNDTFGPKQSGLTIYQCRVFSLYLDEDDNTSYGRIRGQILIDNKDLEGNKFTEIEAYPLDIYNYTLPAPNKSESLKFEQKVSDTEDNEGYVIADDGIASKGSTGQEKREEQDIDDDEEYVLPIQNENGIEAKPEQLQDVSDTEDTEGYVIADDTIISPDKQHSATPHTDQDMEDEEYIILPATEDAKDVLPESAVNVNIPNQEMMEK